MVVQKKKLEAKGLKHQEIQIECLVEHPDKKLPLRAWVDSEGKNPPLILSYDLYEEISYLRPLALEFCKLGFNIYAFPMRGHQELKKTMAFPNSLHRIALDLLQVTAWVRKQEKGQDPFFIAQGFSCLVLFYLLKIHKSYIKGLVLVSPATDFKKPIEPLKRLAIRWLARMFPKLYLPRFLSPQVYTGVLRDKKKKRVRLQARVAEQFLLASSQARKILARTSCQSLFVFPKKSDYYRYESLKKFLTKNLSSDFYKSIELKTKVHNILSAKERRVREEFLSEFMTWFGELKLREEKELLADKKILDRVLGFKKKKV